MQKIPLLKTVVPYFSNEIPSSTAPITTDTEYCWQNRLCLYEYGYADRCLMTGDGICLEYTENI